MEKIFEFEGNQSIRTILLGSVMWFVAVDVCQALGIQNIRRATKQLDDDEVRVHILYGDGGNRQVTIVSEGGLYTIMLRSNGATKPGTIAYKFRRWVTHEVLTSIRKTGSYSIPEKLAKDTLELSNSVAHAFIKHHLDMAWRVRRAMKRAKE